MDLFEAARARNRDQETSRLAAESLDENTLSLLRADIMAALRSAPNGLTTSEIADRLGRPRDSISPRMKALVAGGLISNTFTRRAGPSGRGQIVWVAR